MMTILLMMKMKNKYRVLMKIDHNRIALGLLALVILTWVGLIAS